jgi:hypothetical protein
MRMEGSIETLTHDGLVLAKIVRADFATTGVHFVTPQVYSQQLGYMRHAAGHVIVAHAHNLVPRTVEYTQEVLVIRKGQLRVDFYDDAGDYIESRLLRAGDVILLVRGGHGFEVVEDVDMIEIKQGPFVGEVDKRYFPAVETSRIKLPG